VQRSRAGALSVGGAAVVIGLCAWFMSRFVASSAADPGSRRVIAFRGEAVAWVDERSTDPTGPVGARIGRDVEILASGEHAQLDADIDDAGFVLSARYVRPNQRVVELRSDGALLVDGEARGQIPPPIVLLDILHHIRTTAPLSVSLFEPSSAEWIPAVLGRDGPTIVARALDGEVVARAVPGGSRFGPGAFSEGDVVPERPSAPVEIAVPGRENVAGLRLRRGPPPPRPSDPTSTSMTLPGPFIESDDAAVVAFAAPLCSAHPLEAARRIGEAVFALVDADATTHAPGAKAMLRWGGDCDGAAALATAALRACGVPARVVVGYRLVEPGPAARLVPHALAEVYLPSGAGSGGSWWRLDPTMPSLNNADDRFVPVATGLGGALSMGRVLGVVDEQDLVPLGVPDARP
jgi:hypothetical protein